ncbi:ArsR/SmtB family transcription factor [Henriciella algicola]|jgi:ArsR family transcriptional regulator, arsenate/arsenite/antimonite-responsive transcriptional repressor|uniref:Transcriptional regulator n=1 Tax=Henriciella algicola TaxID=1608422 RepID=A0A399RMN7_9PROT|nr:metalloregulator ArsR/SmtB family transcription factor [Henriciella algicola]RIJ31129.1 transcriptional regulator [Henriciella algicola]
MDIKTALLAFSALSQEGRLEVFRLLVKAGPDGLAAGLIAERAGRAPNTLSAQLNLLQQAGLIESRREGRSIIYSACFDKVSDLIVYLMEDCCAGEPCVASSVQAAAERALCCAPSSSVTS